MPVRILVTLFMLSLTTFAYAASGSATRSFKLSYIAAASVPALVKSSQQLDTLTCNYRDNSVTATGSPDNVAAFASEVLADDVPRTQYQFAIHLISFRMNKKGQFVKQDMAEPVITTTAGAHASISFRTDGGPGFTLQLTAEHSDERSINVNVEVVEYGEYGQILYSGTNSRVIPIDAATQLTGATDSMDQSISRDVQAGRTVTTPGDYSGVYVDVTPNLAS